MLLTSPRFGHVLPDYKDVVRLYDFFLAQPPMMPVYLAAAIVLHREHEILSLGELFGKQLTLKYRCTTVYYSNIQWLDASCHWARTPLVTKKYTPGTDWLPPT